MEQKEKVITKFNIAIDGPVGSGKTTIGKLLAAKLNYRFFDSGLLYRHFAYFYQQNNSLKNKEKLLLEWKNELISHGEEVVFILEAKREELSSPLISDLASQLSPLPELRKIILVFQRELTKNKGWVLVGRDITSEVLPDAKIKIFLTASLEERTRRRNNQHQVKLSPTEAKKELAIRDERDKGRKISPLIKTTDSWDLDTTHLSTAESLEKILQHLNEKLKNS